VAVVVADLLEESSPTAKKVFKKPSNRIPSRLNNDKATENKPKNNRLI